MSEIPTTTVTVERLENLPLITMRWANRPASNDVQIAFKVINEYLNHSETPLFVLVDITQNPRFPMFETVQGALNGPFRNPKLREWLIVGKNSLAKMIESTLAYATQRRNVVWFENEAAALTYLNTLQTG